MKNTKLFYLSIFISNLILSLVFTPKVIATDLFFDDFSNNNLNQWTKVVGNVGSTTTWIPLQGKLHSYVERKGFAYLCANTESDLNDYTFEAEVKNISGVDQGYIFRASPDKDNYYLVNYRYNDSLWPQDNNNVKLYKIYSGGYRLLGIYPSLSVPRSINITQNINHKIKVVLNQNNIKVYFDELMLIDENDEDENIFERGDFCLMTWGGDYSNISENIYDNIIIQDDTRNKVVVLPGLGASWNAGAMLTGSTSPAYQWTMTPFVRNYDLLIDGLEANGLIKDQDFYVWNYDWRKPLSQIVDSFNDYVLSLNLESGEKLNLVGHSLGGLVARVWTQDHPLMVDKSISLGSPHFGAVKAYEAWNGAKISDNLDVASLALNVFLQLQKKNFDTSVQTLRNYAPVVFDLSPTFTFLKRNGINVLASSSQYLVSKNNLLSAVTDKLITVDGIGEDTKEWLDLGDRSLFDKVLGIWQEGRPISFVNGLGDGTVLKKSAQILNAENVEYNSNHGELVDKSVNFVLNKLDLGTTLSIVNNYPLKQTVFYIGSPATMSVNCKGTEFNEVDGWVMAINWEASDCEVKLVGKDGGGTYHLVVGENENWQYFEGEIANQEVINISPQGVENRWLMLERNLTDLGASNAVFQASQRDIIKTIDEYIKYRSSEKVFKYSEEILENMRFILNENNYSNSEIKDMFKKAKSSKSLVETNLRLLSRFRIMPKYSAALNYEQGNSLMNYGRNYGANYLANKLYEIVWK